MFFEISTPPAPGPAHNAPSSWPPGTAAIVLPPFVVPYGDVAVLFVSVDVPSFGQSAGEPQAPVNCRLLASLPGIVVTLQCASRKARSPPPVDVLQTLCAPRKIVFVRTGSETVGAQKRSPSGKLTMKRSPTQSHEFWLKSS